MKSIILFFGVMLSLVHFKVTAQTQQPFSCGTDEILKNNKELQKQVSDRIKAIQNTTSAVDPNTVFTIPVVFVIYHLGETVGSGSNLSDATLTTELAELNDAFRARNANAGQNDVKIQFALAQFDDNCNSATGIVRVNASGVLDYAANGLTYGDSNMQNALRSSHNWNNRNNYITIELVHQLNGASGYSGFLSGYVFIQSNIFWHGLAAHELGHCLNLYHTFQGDNGTQCPPNNNPDTDGDMISDTQPHLQEDWCMLYSPTDLNNCSGLLFGDTFNNFMCYSGPCWNKFSPKQVERMRNSVATYQPVWFNSPNLYGPASPPTALNIIEINRTRVLLSWNTANMKGTSTIEYRPSGSTSWILAGINSFNSIEISSLIANTAYEWRVKVDCSTYTTSTFTTNNTPPLQYCSPSITNPCTYGISLRDVIVGGTYLSVNSGCSATGSLRFSPIKDLFRGQIYSFTLNLEGYYNGTQAAIWIDLNKDGVFESSEKVFTTTSQFTVPITGTFTIPTNINLKMATRMRIILDFYNTPTQPCGSYGYGEWEDYLINITSNCPDIVSLQSPTHDFSSGTTIKQASATNGSITATNKITNTANVTYQAKNITLNNGFKADNGTVFKAEIGGCSN